MAPSTSPTSRRRWLLAAVGVPISAVAAWLAVRGVDLEEAGLTLARADRGLIAVAVGVMFFQTVLRAARWRLLLPRNVAVVPSLRRVLPVTFVGYLGNNILPARLGEGVRAVLLARREALPVPETLGSVLLERVLDTLVLATIGVGAALALGAPGWVIQAALIAVALALIGLTVIATLNSSLGGRFRSAAVRMLASEPTHLVSRSLAVLRRLLSGAQFHERPRDAALASGLSGVAWLLDAAIYLLVARALGIDLALGAAVLISVVAAFSTAVPSAPGYVGTFEFAVATAAGAFGLAPSQALGFAIAVHATALVPMIVVGLLAAWWMGRGRMTSAVGALSPGHGLRG